MTTESPELEQTSGAYSRRGVFGMCSLGLLGVAGLAACGSDDSTSTDAAATAGGSADAASPSATGAAAAETPLVKLSDLTVGGAVSVEAAGKPVIVSLPTADAPVAFQAVCPHKFVTVLVKGEEAVCPAHGSTFDLKTGANLSGPAAGKPLPSVAVKVVNGEIVTA